MLWWCWWFFGLGVCQTAWEFLPIFCLSMPWLYTLLGTPFTLTFTLVTSGFGLRLLLCWHGAWRREFPLWSDLESWCFGLWLCHHSLRRWSFCGVSCASTCTWTVCRWDRCLSLLWKVQFGEVPCIQVGYLLACSQFKLYRIWSFDNHPSA